MRYDKSPKSTQDHIDLLEVRGLIISDQERAAKYLDRIGYYRLTGYMFHLQSNDGNHQFREGVTFDDLIVLYQFDKKLRHLLLEYIERIEVALRAFISNEFSIKYGFFWYTNYDLYEDKTIYDNIISYINDHFEEPSELFLKKFKAKYTSETHPPSNMMMEILTLGKISRLYSGLKNDSEKQSIADKFNLPSGILTSWLIYVTNIRNICAHHSRLWNRKIADRPLIPHRQKHKFNGSVPADFNSTIYGGISIIIRLLSAINPQNSFLNKIVALINDNPSINVADMGFPADWRENPAWV